MTLRLLSILLLGCLVLTGCQPSSTSATLEDHPLSAQDADRQYKARLLVLKDGQTTRQEVINVMGEPDRIGGTVTTRAIMYFWTVKNRDENLLRRSFIIAAFDSNDVLTRHRKTDDEPKYGGAQLPEDAMNEFLEYPVKK